MSPEDSPLSAQLARLHGCLSGLMARATQRALRLHADAVSVEHLLGAVMESEECAAYAVVEHAFADPETLSQELLALSSGIMVVASGSALPFSPLAVEALGGAHAQAAQARSGAQAADGREVDVEGILRHTLRVLPEELRSALVERGLRAESLGETGSAPATPTSGANFFALFSGAAKGVLSQANRKAARARETSIGPAQLLLSALEGQPELQERCGLSLVAARQAVAGKTRDLTEVRVRPLPAEEELVGFLARLPEGAGSLALLEACHGPQGTPELRELFARHMVTPALLERSRGAFPEPTGGS